VRRDVRAIQRLDSGPAFEDALARLLEVWDGIPSTTAQDPALSLDERLSTAAAAWGLADVPEEFLPASTTRLDLLRRAAELAPLDAPYLRYEWASLETDLIEELIHRGLSDEALLRIDRAFEEFGDVPHVLPELLIMKANRLQLSAEYALAMQATREAREILEGLTAEQVPKYFVSTFILVVEASILIDIGLPDRAAPLVRRAQEEAAASSHPEIEGLVMTVATGLAFARNDSAWILDHLLPRLQQGGIPGDEPWDAKLRWADVARARAVLAIRAKQGREAVRSELEALVADLGVDKVNILDSIVTLGELDLALDDLASLRSRIAWLDEIVEKFEGTPPLLTRCSLANFKGRAALLDSTSPEERLEALDDLEDSFDTLLEAWASVPPREGGIGFLLFEDRRTLLATLMRLARACHGEQEGAARALSYLLRAEERGSLADLLDAPKANLELIRLELLPKHGGLLTYLPSGAGSIVVALDDEIIRMWDLPPSDEWNRARERLALALQVPEEYSEENERRLTTSIKELRDFLIPESLDDQIGEWEMVTIVGSESLSGIPFETLPLRSRGNRPLGLELAVSYLPSSTIGLALANRSAARGTVSPTESVRVLVAVGMGETRSGSSPSEPRLIPWNNSDGARLAGHWSSKEVETLTDPARARKAVLESGDRTLAVLEVFAHGVQDESRERNWGFSFDPMNELWCEDIERSSCPPLVALAVCGAGKGRLRRGDDGVSHLGGAFFTAGADCVLISDQELSFEATLALFEEFNLRISAGESPAMSLRSARRAVAEQRRWRHPALHSLVRVVGLGNSPLPEVLLPQEGALDARSGLPRWALPTGLLLALALIGIALRKLRSSSRPIV
jgi:hypothetical protein